MVDQLLNFAQVLLINVNYKPSGYAVALMIFLNLARVYNVLSSDSFVTRKMFNLDLSLAAFRLLVSVMSASQIVSINARVLTLMSLLTYVLPVLLFTFLPEWID